MKLANLNPAGAAFCLVALLASPLASGAQKPRTLTAEARFLGEAPRSFSGVIPCADCEGIRLTVDLFPEGAFLLRQEYLGKNRAAVDLGRWSLGEDGKMTLAGSGDVPWHFRAVGDETLRMLDARGEEIATALNYDLRREEAFRLVGDPVHLSGLYVYMADAGRLTPCLTGKDLPVAQAGASAALEREFAAKETSPGAPLLVTVTGHFTDAPKADGSGTEITFAVDELEESHPGQPCPPRIPGLPAPERSPAGRTWTLVTLRGQPVTGGRGRMAFELRMETGGHHLSGYTGCNRLNGRYAVNGDGLTLTELSTTRMSCPESAAKESAYLQMLGDVTGWKLSGSRLVLYGRKVVIAEFVEKEED